MAKYKIICIAHLLKNNRIAKSGEIVDGSKFVNLQDSLDGRFCELYNDEDDKDDLKSDNKKSAKKPEDSELEIEIKKIKKFDKPTLLEYAKDNHFAITEGANKKTALKEVLKQLEDGPKGQDEEE